MISTAATWDSITWVRGPWSRLLEVGGDALLQVARLADVQHVARRVQHAVDARQMGQAGDEGGGVEHGMSDQAGTIGARRCGAR